MGFNTKVLFTHRYTSGIKVCFTTFASCENLCRVYLQDAKFVNKIFIMFAISAVFAIVQFPFNKKPVLSGSSLFITSSGELQVMCAPLSLLLKSWSPNIDKVIL